MPAALFHRKRKPSTGRKRILLHAGCFLWGKPGKNGPRDFRPAQKIVAWPEGLRKAHRFALGQLSHFVTAHKSFCNWVAENLPDLGCGNLWHWKGLAETFPSGKQWQNHARQPRKQPKNFLFDTRSVHLYFPLRHRRSHRMAGLKVALGHFGKLHKGGRKFKSVQTRDFLHIFPGMAP